MGIKAGNLPTSTIDSTDYLLITEGEAPKRVNYADVKSDIIGTETLETTAQTIKGAINEINTDLSERAKITTADITYYVSTTGLDTNDGLTSGTAFKTIQNAINKLPQIINHAVTINVASGTYNEDVNIAGFTGKGTLNLNGDTVLTDSYVVNSIMVVRTNLLTFIRGFKASTTTAIAFHAANTKRVTFSFCKCVEACNYDGFNIYTGEAYINNSLASNRSNGISAGMCSIAYIESNTGTGNTVGISVNGASTLGKNGTQPSGTTAEVVIGGGVIR